MLWAINRKIVSGKCLQESWHKSIRLVLPVGENSRRSSQLKLSLCGENAKEMPNIFGGVNVQHAPNVRFKLSLNEFLPLTFLFISLFFFLCDLKFSVP